MSARANPRLILLMVMVGCSEPAGVGEPAECLPGGTQLCLCAPDRHGVQLCMAGGDGWGACDCAAADAESAGSPGPDGGVGTGGNANACAGSLDCPWPPPLTVNQAFGAAGLRGVPHLAVDLQGGVGRVAHAACSGPIVFAGDVGGYGSHDGAAGPVTLQQCDDVGADVVVTYGHCRASGPVGQVVARGQEICRLAFYRGPGGADWTHLHFGARLGRFGDGGNYFRGYDDGTERTFEQGGRWVDPLAWRPAEECAEAERCRNGRCPVAGLPARGSRVMIGGEGGAVYLVSGQLHGFVNEACYRLFFDDFDGVQCVAPVVAAELGRAPLICTEGSFVKLAGSSTVYQLADGVARPLCGAWNEDRFRAAFGVGFDVVLTVPDAWFDRYPVVVGGMYPPGHRAPACGDADFACGVHVDPEGVCWGRLDCAPCARCVDADGDGYGRDCPRGHDCDDGNPATYPGASEVCNGLDDDCDGDVDEGVRNACGGCGAVPVEVCNGRDDDCDGEVDEGCNGCRHDVAEVCNGRDDDCDGDVDEGVLNACDGCGAVPVEICNGRDDDCDGDVDEGVRNACGSCGVVPVEVCNGRDDDCDGEVDEGVRNACGGCGAVPAEICNGRDDDCDGEVDEGCGANLPPLRFDPADNTVVLLDPRGFWLNDGTPAVEEALAGNLCVIAWALGEWDWNHVELPVFDTDGDGLWEYHLPRLRPGLAPYEGCWHPQLCGGGAQLPMRFNFRRCHPDLIEPGHYLSATRGQAAHAFAWAGRDDNCHLTGSLAVSFDGARYFASGVEASPLSCREE